MEAVTYRCLLFCLGMLWLILWYLWPLDHVNGAMTYTTLGQYFSVLYFFFYFLIDIYIFVLAVVNVLLYLCCIDITVISNAFELLGFCFTFCLEIWIINILSSLECGIIVLSSVPHGDCGFSDYPLSVFPIIFLPFQNSCFVENTRKALAHYGPDSNLCIWLLTLLKLITVIWKLDHDGMCITDSEQINKKLCRIFETCSVKLRRQILRGLRPKPTTWIHLWDLQKNTTSFKHYPAPSALLLAKHTRQGSSCCANLPKGKTH